PTRVGAERSDRSNRAPSGLVRVAMSDFAEETTEAGVAERPLSRLCKIDRTGRGKDLVHASARGRGLKGSCEQEQARDQVREDEDGDGDDDAPAEDVVDQPIHVLDFGHDGAAQGGDAALDEPQSPTGRDQIETPGRRLRSIASPMAARKTAKAKRTFEAFECSSSRVPRFVPEKTPMITIAARPGSTRPWEQ